MVSRKALIFIALLVPFASVRWTSHALADRAGLSVSRSLTHVSSMWAAAHANEPPIPQPEASEALGTPALPSADESSVEPADRNASRPTQSTARKRALRSSSRGILVKRQTVQAAVKAGLRPSGVAVPQTAEHPAGLRVHGWGRVGAGLKDGDLITKVGARTPSCVEDIVGAVIAAYRKKVYAISGKLWRRGEEISVLVELPYPPEDDPNANP